MKSGAKVFERVLLPLTLQQCLAPPPEGRGRIKRCRHLAQTVHHRRPPLPPRRRRGRRGRRARPPDSSGGRSARRVPRGPRMMERANGAEPRGPAHEKRRLLSFAPKLVKMKMNLLISSIPMSQESINMSILVLFQCRSTDIHSVFVEAERKYTKVYNCISYDTVQYICRTRCEI